MASMICLGTSCQLMEICQPRKGGQSKRLASSKEYKGISFIPLTGILLPPVYSKLCPCGHDSTLINWSDNVKKNLGFTKEFIVEINALLKDLHAILSQEDNTGKIHVIVYTSRLL